MIDATTQTTRRHSIAAQTLSTLPSFVLDTFPDFTKFLTAYLAWSESIGNPAHLIGLIRTARDIDTSPAEFMALLQKEYAPSLSAERTAFGASDKTLNYSKIDTSFLKNIRQFYLAKGTPGSFVWLFNTLYNLQTEIQPAGNTVMRPSSSNWSSPYILYVRIDDSVELPTENILRDISASITLKNDNTQQTLPACALMNGVQIVSRKKTRRIAAIQIESINFSQDVINTFIADLDSNKLKIEVGVVYDEQQIDNSRDLTVWNNLLHSETNTVCYTISKAKIIDGGKNWINGEKVSVLPNPNGYIFWASTINSLNQNQEINSIVSNGDLAVVSTAINNSTMVTVYVRQEQQWVQKQYPEYPTQTNFINKLKYISAKNWPPQYQPGYPVVTNPYEYGAIALVGEGDTIYDYVGSNARQGRLYVLTDATKWNTLEGWQQIVPNSIISDRTTFIVSATNSAGAIRNLDAIDVGYFGSIDTPQNIKTNGFIVFPESQNGTNENIDLTIGVFAKPLPVLLSSTSLASDSSIILRDMYRYHDNAYSIKTLNGPIPANFNKQEYTEFAHPAGMGWFLEEAVGTAKLCNKQPTRPGFEPYISRPQIEIQATIQSEENRWTLIDKIP